MGISLEPQLSPETVSWELSTPLVERKKLGQYMTPKNVQNVLLEKIPFKNGDKILDPAVGTGEFLKTVKELPGLTGLEVYGWDVDSKVLSVAEQLVPDAHLSQHSLFDSQEDYLNFFDAVIGNPPYFETKLSDSEKSLFTTLSGRVNIYGLFFERYLPVVKEGGYLGFIVPPSMNAGAYFEKLRGFIMKNADVEHVSIVRANDLFTEALTSVQAIVLKKKTSGVSHDNRFVIDFSKFSGSIDAPVVFSDNKDLVVKCFEGKESLSGLGYKVVTGTIPWNQFKTDLYDTPVTDSHPLLYAKDISSDNKLVLSDKVSSRRFLVSSRPVFTDEALLVNRIVGGLNNPRLKIAYVDGSEPFYAENHVNVVVKDPSKEQKVTMTELYDRILAFPFLSDYLKALTGNTQLSAKELMFLLPV